MKIRGLSYEQVCRRFAKAGLPASRSSVTRAFRWHGIDPARITYKTVRWKPADVHHVIKILLSVGTHANGNHNHKWK